MAGSLSRKFFILRREMRSKVNSLLNSFSGIFSSHQYTNEKETRISSRSNQMRSSSTSKENKRGLSFPSAELKMSQFSKENLLLFSVIFSVIGVVSLFLLSVFLTPKFVYISSIEDLPDGAYIKTIGFVSSINENQNQFKLCDSLSTDSSRGLKQECISVMVSQGIPLWILNGDYITVVGIVKKIGKNQYLTVQNPKEIQKVQET